MIRGVSGTAVSTIDPLNPAKKKDSPEEIRKAAKEMESLFAYEMIKSMRAATGATGKTLGGDSYATLFDLELSKVLAERGLGLQDMLERGLKSLAAKAGASTGADKDVHAGSGTPAAHPLPGSEKAKVFP